MMQRGFPEVKGDLSDYICVRLVGLGIPDTADQLGFPQTNFCWVYRERSEIEIISSEQHALMSEVRGEWAKWFEMIEIHEYLS